MKFRRFRWVGNVARMGDKRTTYRFLVGGNLHKREHFENLGPDKSIILK
jgi:hypothetical protein